MSKPNSKPTTRQNSLASAPLSEDQTTTNIRNSTSSNTNPSTPQPALTISSIRQQHNEKKVIAGALKPKRTGTGNDGPAGINFQIEDEEKGGSRGGHAGRGVKLDLDDEDDLYHDMAERRTEQGPWVLEEIRKRKEEGVSWWKKGRLPFYHFREVPRYMQDNPDIWKHYRCGYSYHENWISLFHLHNESGNIWTHLLATILFLSLSNLIPSLNVNGIGERSVLVAFLLMSTYTFWSSALFHLHTSHSRSAYVFFGCLDYSGISAGVCGTAISMLYYLFYCDPQTRYVWLAIICLVNTTGIFGPIFSFWPTREFRSYRAYLYMMSAIASTGPLLHFMLLYGWSALPGNFAIPGFLLMLGCYFFGTMVYVLRLPER
ncbi:hypothetical protein HDU76_001921 [Blyttiomyces sp. JEL0837]|nr:hypothetical protein HDU76_001921 [Blyttiomyces sp. JEL0837]